MTISALEEAAGFNTSSTHSSDSQPEKGHALSVWDRPGSVLFVYGIPLLFAVLGIMILLTLALALGLGLGLHGNATPAPPNHLVDLGYARYQGCESR